MLTGRIQGSEKGECELLVAGWSAFMSLRDVWVREAFPGVEWTERAGTGTGVGCGFFSDERFLGMFKHWWRGQDRRDGKVGGVSRQPLLWPSPSGIHTLV